MWAWDSEPLESIVILSASENGIMFDLLAIFLAEFMLSPVNSQIVIPPSDKSEITLGTKSCNWSLIADRPIKLKLALLINNLLFGRYSKRSKKAKARILKSKKWKYYWRTVLGNWIDETALKISFIERLANLDVIGAIFYGINSAIRKNLLCISANILAQSNLNTRNVLSLSDIFFNIKTW